MKHQVLLADDESIIRKILCGALERAGYAVISASNGEEALARFHLDTTDAVILDVNMPGKDGFFALAAIRQITANVPIVMITAYGSIESAVKAMKLGANDYITKPFDGDDLVEKIERLLRLRASQCGTTTAASAPSAQLVGTGQAMRQLQGSIQKIRDFDVTVLITGESGTGKNVVARALHYDSHRAARPFIHVNCAALPDNLMESELFGYEKGAFTGALTGKPGKFELAGDGTIFLDEISTLSLSLQPKLLSVLQERYFERVGGSKRIAMNARIVTATNEDLEAAVEAHRFREDLYYRLNVVRLDCPPLRGRAEDIAALASVFLTRFIAESKKEFSYIEAEVWQALAAYGWPGNVRQLENTLQSLVLLADGPSILLSDLPKQVRDCVAVASRSQALTLKDREVEDIIAALENNHGHREKTACQLGISRRTLQYKLKELGLLSLAEPKQDEDEAHRSVERDAQRIPPPSAGAPAAASPPKPRISFRTFGRFDVFADGRLLDFSSAKAKELLALCADRAGGEVSMAEAIDKLWELRAYDDRSKNLYRKAVSYIKQVFLEQGCPEIFESARGRCHVNRQLIQCDYFDYLDGKDVPFSGEYLFDYSWAEETLARLVFRNDRFETTL